ncbi:MAG: hypothetical protein KDC53_24505, partial [Saprospiraceae bacterium]|nr:hypothetical protein [Saprospiraceae bacterium]
NTDLIMKTPWTRHERLTYEKTAKFLAMIDIDEPTLVTIEIQSPVNSRQALIHASTELWIIPGKDILGDGIIVEIPGFVVELLKPRTHQYVSLDELKDGIIEIQANVVMMCGCPISKDGIWDSQKIEVMAIIKKDGNQVETMPLEWVADNLFEASFPTDEKGQYEVIVYAFDGMTGNTGVDKVNYIIR